MRVELLCATAGLDRAELERWIEEQWVRPAGPAGAWEFGDIDIARVRLIVSLRREMSLDEESMPVVLSLLDQLYATRRQMRRLCAAIEGAPDEIRAAVAERLSTDP